MEEIDKLRAQFPTLHQQVNGKPLIYLDNGATTQKPLRVIERISDYYINENANVHRGVHALSQIATDAYEDARKTIQEYIGAEKSHEIIFTKGATDSLNLVAFSLGEGLKEGDEIIISAMEHHSNIVPWQMVCQRKGSVLKAVPFDDNGNLMIEALDDLLTPKTKVVSITQVSNALGTINDIKTIIEKAHAVGAKVVIDGAQGIQHLPINVRELDIDFYAFSGHKVYGPTGIGVLYGKEALLNEMPPYQGGGDMIREVTLERTTYNELPYKFEAGTPNIAGAIGLGEAFKFLKSLDLTAIFKYEEELLEYATKEMKQIEGVRIYGEANHKTSVISFLVDGQHPYDVGTLLDKMGVAVRTGHHCTQPIMDYYCIPGTIRASIAMYNTKEDIDALVASLYKIIPILQA